MLVMTLLDNVECTFDPCHRNWISLFQSTHAQALKTSRSINLLAPSSYIWPFSGYFDCVAAYKSYLLWQALEDLTKAIQLESTSDLLHERGKCGPCS
jgi:hypothetical protein